MLKIVSAPKVQVQVALPIAIAKHIQVETPATITAIVVPHALALIQQIPTRSHASHIHQETHATTMVRQNAGVVDGIVPMPIQILTSHAMLPFVQRMDGILRSVYLNMV